MRRVTLLFPIAGTVALAAVAAPAVPAAIGAADRTSITGANRWVAPWSVVSGPLSGNQRPDLHRSANGTLHLIWAQTDSGGTHSVRVRQLDPGGRPRGGVATVESGMLIASGDPQLTTHGPDLLAVYAGIGALRSRRSPNGATWSAQPGTLTQSTAAQSAQSIAALDVAGQPLVAFAGVSPAVVLHRGFITGSPSDTADFTAAATCCSYDVALARDTSTGQAWVAWHATGATAASQAGLRVQRVWPGALGPVLQAPGSVDTSLNSTSPGQPVALVARAGGGIWVAYLVGYPTSSSIRLWKVGTTTQLNVRAGGPTKWVALTTGPGGRLWLSWHTFDDNRLHAARTNRAVTRLGPVITLPIPGGATSQLRGTTTEGSTGPLTMVASTQVGTAGSPSLYAYAVRPALAVTAKPRKLSSGKVRVRVTDAGDAVRGATVKLVGKKVTTNARGKAKVRVPRATSSGSYKVVAKRSGYQKALVRIKVT